MLYRFEITNYHSIRETQILELRVNNKVPEQPERFAQLFPASSDRAVRVVSLFGANAAGKSNVLKALAFLGWFAADSSSLSPEGSLPVERFNDAEASALPTRLAVEFSGPAQLHPGAEASVAMAAWRYEVELISHGGRLRVQGERLRQRADGRGKWVRVFDRSEDKTLSNSDFELRGFSQVADKVRGNASLISTLAQFGHPPSSILRGWAKLMLGNIFMWHEEFSADRAVKFYADHPDAYEALNGQLHRIDLGLRRMNIVAGPNGPLAYFEHEGLEQQMPWVLQSHGTQNFIKNFPLIEQVLRLGGLAIIDEIDIAIHPLLLPEIVGWFHDRERNPLGAQLWFTCHSASLLEELAKEEVFFCEKDSKGRTTVYALADIQDARRSDNQYRKYMSGIYGAVPQLG